MLLVWMRALLSIHTAYLMSVPDLAKVIRNLYGYVGGGREEKEAGRRRGEVREQQAGAVSTRPFC